VECPVSALRNGEAGCDRWSLYGVRMADVERQVSDHERRIRDLERKVTNLEHKMAEMARLLKRAADENVAKAGRRAS
jgi:predicted  nucleic acid-binding Zn-ribbon protein